MPLGDSITYGDGSSDWAGYRPYLFNLATTQSQKLTFVGSGRSGPAEVDGIPFPTNHEGHSGWTIANFGSVRGLYPEVETWLKATPADIILLHIGTNDITLELELDNAPLRFATLLDKIDESAPNALIVVAQIVPTQDDAKNLLVSNYNDALARLVRERSKRSDRILLIDMFHSLFYEPEYKTSSLKDLYHPNDYGYQLMATSWYDVIGGLLPR